ncbi:MAG TPA: metalloregulator ArsR/SmtB family transcription factor [Actinocrinis sp.]|uniref:ArsR/SmtB family transcription factor n=1 Tax=Actinocrinis sp. TaxID=1920516 RepID=UPI002DDD5E86|nr:metalloregulator ArsR/SmtB family transcription factor [Actinocrinis sp.]HEV2344947.1 metalloregulator ArsR/SmtB family transcription factor [Actinocrinis sp.]
MSVAAVMEALAEPNRRRIVELLLDGERSVNRLAADTGLAQPAVSKHLRVLRDAGLVEVRREAQRRLYRIRPAPLAELDAWLEPYRRLWNERLDRLERHLKGKPQAQGKPRPEAEP